MKNALIQMKGIDENIVCTCASHLLHVDFVLTTKFDGQMKLGNDLMLENRRFRRV